MALFRCKTQREKGLTHYGVATNMSYNRGYFAATTVGNYALFAGNVNSEYNSNTVDVYTVL